MILHKNQWHVKWFLWNLKVLNKFKGYSSNGWTPTLPNMIDLCTYMRTFVMGSAAVLLSLTMWLLMAVFMVLPFYLFGIFQPVVTVLLAVGFVIGVVVFISLIISVPSAVRWTVQKLTPTEEKKPVGFLICILQWIVAAKRHICPIIKFTGDRNND